MPSSTNQRRSLSGYLRQTIIAISQYRPDFDLAFLGDLGVTRALAWLERWPGVGRKVSALARNFSTLRLPSFVIDTHILRILRRFGFVPRRAEIPIAYDLMIGMFPGWRAADLSELHVLMKRLGQRICCADYTHRPGCPVRQRCRTAAENGHNRYK